ncbi:hypothetical protein Plhal304r1_c029g0096491 [Plasmopara halstedii]
MDLSMILCPVLEEEKPASPVSPREPNRKWSTDELQCAVAILQDFQQPSVTDSVPNVHNKSDVKVTHDNNQEQKHNQEKQQHSKKHDRASDKDANGVSLIERKVQEQNLSAEDWEDDSMSKLDLLVQADALIKRSSPKVLSPLARENLNYVRSGVWSRAEEEYAAALVSFFLKGLLDLPEGVTLRKFLAEKLCCNRRRVSMKLGTETLAGQKIPKKIGASVYVSANPPPSDHIRREAECMLEELRAINFSTRVLNNNVQDDKGGDQPLCLNGKEDEDEKEEKIGALQTRKEVFGQKRKSDHYNLKSKRRKPTIIRTGFESHEEEEFVTTVFEYFIAGSLDLPEGTRLVAYLCQQLGCSPKQLSMKLAPQRMNDHKFPDNVGSITYARKMVKTDNMSSDSSDDNDISEECFEVESRITELRLAYEDAHKIVPLQVATPVKRERKSIFTSRISSETATLDSTPSVSPMRVFRRSGPWSHDEEVYAAALIDSFFKGVLDVAEGTTLRSFLSSRLCCNPMRISKKLASESIAAIPIPKKLGSSTYVRNVKVTPEERVRAEGVLYDLRAVYMFSGRNKRDGAKRSRHTRVRRPRMLVGALSTDSDNTESDLDTPTAADREKRIETSRKTANKHYAAWNEQMQRSSTSSNLFVPALLKEQLA